MTSYSMPVKFAIHRYIRLVSYIIQRSSRRSLEYYTNNFPVTYDGIEFICVENGWSITCIAGWGQVGGLAVRRWWLLV